LKAIDEIAKTTTEVLERADVAGITPTAAAEALVAQRLHEGVVNLE
jgi:hypothetical protein